MPQIEELQERALNEAAFRQLEGFIRQTYPHNHFVAIRGGQIVADAASFEELDTILDALGKEFARTLVVQAGVNYPAYLDMLAQESRP